MKTALIAAVARNGVIGADGKLPWRQSEDLKRFKAITWGKPIVMGRRTFESVGRPLPGRANIVVTRDRRLALEGAIVAASPEEGIALAGRIAERGGISEICVIGGAEIFRQTLGGALRIYLTRVDAASSGAARFPELAPEEWRKTAAGSVPACPGNDNLCRFFILDRLPGKRGA
jgi:dihydrofolate reductase